MIYVIPLWYLISIVIPPSRASAPQWPDPMHSPSHSSHSGPRGSPRGTDAEQIEIGCRKPQRGTMAFVGESHGKTMEKPWKNRILRENCGQLDFLGKRWKKRKKQVKTWLFCVEKRWKLRFFSGKRKTSWFFSVRIVKTAVYIYIYIYLFIYIYIV